jgi:lysozyme
MTDDTYDLQLLEEELTFDEGRESKMYTDSRGYSTVGVGHNMSIPQSDQTIDALFATDIAGAEASLDATWPWWRQLSPVRQRVMLNMMFNLGHAGLAKFPLFLTAMRDGQWTEAGLQLSTSAWRDQVGMRAVRLIYMVENNETMKGAVR